MWILLSDQIARLFFTDVNTLTDVQSIKGGVFILATTLFLFLLLKRMIGRIEHGTLIDTLTKLPNRIAFKRKINSRTQEALQAKKQFYVVTIDIAKFSNFNNELGNGKGDDLLQNFASGLINEISPQSYIARISGDEFGVISPMTEQGSRDYLDEVALIAKQTESICSTVAPRPIKAQIAVAVYPKDANDSKGIVRSLGIALSYAKSHSKSPFTEYFDSYRLNILDRLTMLEELTRAIDEKEFSVVYQPQWDLTTNQWHGAEVLIRWTHPQLGVISPIQFIEIAEEEGLIGKITEIVFDKALTELQENHISRTTLPKISFNFSYAIIGNEPCISILEDKIKQATSQQLSEIIIELTETAVVFNVDATQTLLMRWKNLGVQFSIDDFGTGNTSLSQLQQLPIDELKIDRSFIAGIPGHPTNSEITIAIMAMAQKLDKTVIAEGVETHAQSDFLQKNGCKIVQGYLFAKPQDILTLKTTLEKPPQRSLN
tara:strand:- start:165 stop:1625 length:1461 start_codon:yes stop_codon:yes gene_type:complete